MLFWTGGRPDYGEPLRTGERVEGAAYGRGRVTVHSGMVTCRCTHRDLEDNKRSRFDAWCPTAGLQEVEPAID